MVENKHVIKKLDSFVGTSDERCGVRRSIILTQLFPTMTPIGQQGYPWTRRDKKISKASDF
jgi:hypothetical protein